MRAITLLPGVPNSAQLDDIPEPPDSQGSVLVRTLALGVPQARALTRRVLYACCGTLAACAARIL